jgi:hypothetical protein
VGCGQGRQLPPQPAGSWRPATASASTCAGIGVEGLPPSRSMHRSLQRSCAPVADAHAHIPSSSPRLVQNTHCALETKSKLTQGGKARSLLPSHLGCDMRRSCGCQRTPNAADYTTDYLLISFLLWSRSAYLLLYVSRSLDRELCLSRPRTKNNGSLPLVRIASALLCALCLASVASDEEIRDRKVFDRVMRPVRAEGHVQGVVRADRGHEADGIAGVRRMSDVNNRSGRWACEVPVP